LKRRPPCWAYYARDLLYREFTDRSLIAIPSTTSFRAVNSRSLNAGISTSVDNWRKEPPVSSTNLEELECSLTAPSLTGHTQRLVTSNQPAEATRRIRFGKRRSRKRLTYSIVVVKTAVAVYRLLIRREVILATASLAERSALCRRWKEGVRTCHQHTPQSRNHRCAACMLFWGFWDGR
jgi:hypothetical protein